VAPQTIYIHTETGIVRRTLTGAEAPNLVGIHRAALGISVAFVTSGAVVALAANTTVRFVAKVKGSHKDDPKLLDLEPTVSGEGTGTRYLLSTLCDSLQLRDALGTSETITLRCQVDWQIPGEDAPRLSLPFDLTITQAYSRGADDDIPDTVANAWDLGLNARAVRHDAVQTLTSQQKARALANLGITITNDEFRVVCPDGVTRRALLSDLEA
jgi:hypothetical protein